MRILITGASGYLARAMVKSIEGHNHDLRLMDVQSFETPHELVIGNVSDLDAVRRAVTGMDAIVIAHMAKNPDAYVNPLLPFDVNVKGTANLLFAAAEQKTPKVVLISSAGVTRSHDVAVHHHTLAPKTKGLYYLTKACQEVIAEQFAREAGIAVSVLRIGYVVDGETQKDKYDRKITTLQTMLTDGRDVGEAARLCIERDDISYEVFNVIGTDEAIIAHDTSFTRERLGWTPRFNFSTLRKTPPK